MGTNSMHVAKTGLNAQQRRMQVIANNLANVNTTGFKRERVNLETLLYQVLRSSGEQTSADTNLTSAFSVGTGVRIVNTQKLYTQGSLVNTDNALDLAIDGSGFFQVLLPDGRIGFTRNGSFSRNAEGTLVTPSGYTLQPEIAIPEGVTEINVSADGLVSVQVAGEAEAAEEQSEFEIFLADVGDKKIDVIKAVRTITGLGLKEAKAIVDGAPASVKEGANKEEADTAKSQLEEAGATVELK